LNIYVNKIVPPDGYLLSCDKEIALSGSVVRCQLFPTFNGTIVLARRDDFEFKGKYNVNNNGDLEEEVMIVVLESVDSIDDEFSFEFTVPSDTTSISITETKASKPSNTTSPPIVVILVGKFIFIIITVLFKIFEIWNITIEIKLTLKLNYEINKNMK